jgi:predicted outer membrane repeat protein
VPSKQSLVFCNNTCISKGGLFYPAGGAQSSPPAMVTIYNNIFVSGGTPVTVCAGSIARCDYNVYQVSAGANVQGLTQIAAPRGAATGYALSALQKTGQDAHSVVSGAASTELFGATRSLDPSSYQLQSSAVGRNLGRVGGAASNAATDAGAWGAGATRIGCDFGPAPRAPVLGIS